MAPPALDETYLKWYELCRPDQTIDPAVDAEAWAFIDAEVASGRLPIAGDLGFVINHLSGEHIYLLLVFTWRGNNEMWESVFYKDVRDGAPFRVGPADSHRGAICVGEFGVVAHELWRGRRICARPGTRRQSGRMPRASSPG